MHSRGLHLVGLDRTLTPLFIMSSHLNALNAIVNDPKYADYLAIVKGARNGFVYGPFPALG
jgi:hypothetical protein